MEQKQFAQLQLPEIIIAAIPPPAVKKPHMTEKERNMGNQREEVTTMKADHYARNQGGKGRMSWREI